MRDESPARPEAAAGSFAELIDRYRFPEGYRSLFLAAIASFAEQGFHATTTRQIAAGAGLSPTALYVHFASKEEVLYRIAVSALDLTTEMTRAAAASTSSATGRLAATVRALSAWNAHHLPVARVVLHQLDALAPDHLADVVERRHAMDHLVRGIIAQGRESGEFDVEDAVEAAIGVLSLCLDVARWYRPGAGRSPEQVGDRNAAAALRLVGARDPRPSQFLCDPASGEEFQTRIAELILARAGTENTALIGRDGLLTGITGRVLQSALDAELDAHLARTPGPGESAAGTGSNGRNGSSPKTVRTAVGPVDLRTPRDRDGSFEPRIVPKHARSVAGFAEVVFSLHSKGLPTGAIRDHLKDVYDIDVSRSHISRLTGLLDRG